jgi:hypothetical protein
MTQESSAAEDLGTVFDAHVRAGCRTFDFDH